MTDAHPTDEQLSAALDGADQAAADHAAGCPSCRTRLAQLQAVATAVAVPPAPLDQLAKERAMAQALASARGASARNESTVSLSARRRVPGWVGIAAAVLVALVVVPLLVRDGPSGNDVASKSTGQGSAADVASEVAAADGGDLGSVDDAQALRAIVAPGLGQSMAAGGAGSAADSTGAAGQGAARPNAGRGPAASPTSTTVPAAPQAQNAPASGLTTGGRPNPPCASTTRQRYGQGLASLVYAATLTWQGTPAVALGYSVTTSGGSLNHRVFVLARSTCIVLTVLSL
ncbi:MAG: hypothetical protein QOI20_1910 [Acidimicrobiaceae bacterium]|jgi:hypothetical protein|nr:hypothetical protein [Acidimicrobiaceae bacterium]